MQLARSIAALTAITLASGCVFPGPAISPYGKTATLYGDGQTSGELLAIHRDSIWLMRDEGVAGVRTETVHAINVERHPFDATRTFAAIGGIGLGTGIALSVACASYGSDGDKAGCLLAVPVSVLIFGILGLPFVASNNYSSQYHLVPADSVRLRGYARFPQGLPDSLRPRNQMKPAGVTNRPRN